MNQIRLLVCTSLLAVSQLAASPTPAAAQAVRLAPLSAAQIVERNLAARGGEAAWQQVRTMTITGKMDAGQERKDGGPVATFGLMSEQQRRAFERQLVKTQTAKREAPKVIQLPFKMDLSRPRRMRLEIPFQGETAVQVYDGTQGWKLRPFLGRHEVEPYTADELKAAASEQELDGPLVDYLGKGTKVATDGTELIDGRAAYRLKLTLKGGAQRRLWVDGETFLDVKLEGAPRHFNGKPRRVFTVYKDFKAVQGLKMPYTLETHIDSAPQVEQLVVEHVTINPTLDPSVFTKPK